MVGMIETGADSSAGGDGGIRTLDRPLQAYNGLANRRLQPLGHVSNMPGMPDTAASRKRQNQGLCVLSPESDRRTTAKAWRMDQRGTRSRFALSIYVCIHPRDCRIRRCQGAFSTTSPAQILNQTPELRRDGRPKTSISPARGPSCAAVRVPERNRRAAARSCRAGPGGDTTKEPD